MKVMRGLVLLLVVVAQSPVTRAAGASMSDMPVEVQKALLSLCEPCKFADNDAPWNPTDVIDNLPQRHLVAVEKRGSRWFIKYDHGGYATHSHTVILELSQKLGLVEGSSCMPSKEKQCEW